MNKASKVWQIIGQYSLLVLLMGIMGGCTNKTVYKVAGTTYSLVKIKDSGELYSTYEMESDDEETLEKKGLTKSTIQAIQKMGNEQNWPEGIATLDAREANRPKIADYKTYKVAQFNAKTILLVPKARNQEMPEKMRPTQDIYFIIGDSGLE